MAFKLGSESREIRTPENTPIFKKKLRDGVNAEANNDGTIFIDSSIKKGTSAYKKAVNHEIEHINQMESGKAAYSDDSVTWKGQKYPRERGGIIYKGRWFAEGDENLPWEKEAIAAETKK
jgi:hypothetical protein